MTGAELTAPAWIDPAVDRRRILLALALVVVVSRLPEILLRAAGVDVSWVPWAIVGLTAILWLGGRVLAPLRPLAPFLAIMIAVNLAIAIVGAVLESTAWRTLVTDPDSMPALLASRVLMAAAAVLTLGTAVLIGARPRELYLGLGRIDAPTRSRRQSGGYVPWTRFGPLAVIGLMLLMVWFGFPILPDQIDLGAAGPALLIGAVAALLNAFWEEATFRIAPLSLLQRAVGPGAAVLILAVYFGIGHYEGGVPSGPTGLVATGLVAVLFGRALIETRGWFWPITLHFSIDLVIFSFLAIASVAP